MHSASAQDAVKESPADAVPARPVVEYKSSQMRDPFRPLKAVKEKVKQEKAGDLKQAGANIGNLKVEGMIWGGRFPQAIINERVLNVGDTIDGAEILSIDKNGITLSSNGVLNVLTVTGVNPVSGENPVVSGSTVPAGNLVPPGNTIPAGNPVPTEKPAMGHRP